MITLPELVISANCLRRADFATRVEAASLAGFAGIGIRVSDYVSAIQREGLTDRDLVRILEANAITIYEVEAAWDWTDQASPFHRQTVSTLRRMSEALGFRQFNAFIFEPLPAGDLAEGLGALCDALPGSIVALEHIGYGPVRTLGDAVAVHRAVGRDNAALILDSWHYARTGSNLGDLSNTAAISSIQISDVLERPRDDMADEARHHRQFPADGAMLLTEWLADVLGRGVRCPISIEVVNDELDPLQPSDIARSCYAALTQLIASVATRPRQKVTTR